jgi:hypothetical protein
MSNTLETTLNERGAEYGAFSSHAEITQALKRFYRGELDVVPDSIRGIMAAKWKELSADQQEALDMQVHKDGRIFNGNHNNIDSWVDKAGYNKLVSDRLTDDEQDRRIKAAISRIPVPAKATPKSKKRR